MFVNHLDTLRASVIGVGVVLFAKGKADGGECQQRGKDELHGGREDWCFGQLKTEEYEDRWIWNEEELGSQWIALYVLDGSAIGDLFRTERWFWAWHICTVF